MSILEQAQVYREPDGRVLLRWGWPIKHRNELIIVEQEEHERMLEYTVERERLSQVVFPDANHVDLRELPKRDLVSPLLKLVELFNAKDIIPITGEEPLVRR